MQMACTILHSGKQKTIYYPQRKKRRWKENPASSSTLLPSVGLLTTRAPSEHHRPASLQPPCLCTDLTRHQPHKQSERSHCISLCNVGMGTNLSRELTVWRWTKGGGDLPQTNIWSSAFNPDSLWALSFYGERLLPIYGLQFCACEEPSVRWWQRGEEHRLKWREGEGGRGGEGKGGAGGSENPLYTQTACLAGYPSGTASHFLSTSPSSFLLLPPLSNSPVLSTESRNDKKKKKTEKKQRWRATGRNTRRKMTKHADAETTPHPSQPLRNFSSSPCNLHPRDKPFSKNTETWIKKSKN